MRINCILNDFCLLNASLLDPETEKKKNAPGVY